MGVPVREGVALCAMKPHISGRIPENGSTMRTTFIATAFFLVCWTTVGVHAADVKWTPELKRAARSAESDDHIAVWIFFADKGPNLPGKLAAAEMALTPNARARRLRNRGLTKLVDHHDIPVNPDYARNISKHVEKTRHVSRWLNAVSVRVRAASLPDIASMGFVERLDVVRRCRLPLPEAEPVDPGLHVPRVPLSPHAFDYGPSLTQNDQINVPALHNLGYNGNGVLICMMDAGFNNLGHEAFALLHIQETRDFVNGDSIVWDQGGQMGTGNHGTWTLSVIAGMSQGQLIGPAWGASFLLAKTENTDWERHIEEDDWVAAAEWADSLGADIISSSVGYSSGFTHGEPNYAWQDMDGNTAITTIGADIAAGRGILVVNSAGNSGPVTPPANSLIAPSDGDSVLGVGAVDASGNRAGFSSMGPTSDGRIKPDVMAMGQAVILASHIDPAAYVSSSGTSFSCPLAAGAAALVLEANPTMTNMEILDALRNTADNASTPDNAYGWGIIDAYAAAFSVTGVGASPPALLTLYPAYPNPFNPSTTVRYNLPHESHVVLKVFDVLGREITTLVNHRQSEGPKSVLWNGTTPSGASVGSGVYFFRLQAGDETRSRKAVLLK
jgi:subtilisin family serine protease